MLGVRVYQGEEEDIAGQSKDSKFPKPQNLY